MKHVYAGRALPVAVVLVAATVLGGCSSGDAPAATPTQSQSQSIVEMPEGASTVAGDFELYGFWVKESSLDMSAGFGTIMNTGAADDSLTGAAASGVPAIELHQTVDGVMSQVESFAVPADGSLTLSPGGNHLMLMGLTDPLAPGGSIDITLQFASGATATITSPIEPFSGDDGHGHM